MSEDRIATREDGKTHPMPDQCLFMQILECDEAFTEEEMTAIKRGFIPRGADDRWFIFYEDGWLYCHHRETGNLIYQANFGLVNGGVYLVNELHVNNDPEQYTPSDVPDDFSLFLLLIIHTFLKRPPVYL